MKIDMLNPKDNKPLLLLVDSNMANIAELNRVFEKNYRIMYSTSGIDAIVKVKEQAPDVILLDINMSDVDSYYICNTLKDDENTQNVPVILISRKSPDNLLSRKQTEKIILKGYESGAADIIFPPINPMCIQARVRSHVAFKLQSDYINSITVVDNTTGLYNRKKFNDFLNTNWRLCMREQRPISLLMLNVDYFQEYNNQYGKEYADNCLKQIGDVLHKVLKRPSDVCSRYKNEEFACLLPFTHLDGALKVADDILNNVRELHIENMGSKISKYVTTSIGLSSMIPSSWSINESKLMTDADLALYQCEQNGHNCVAVHV